MTSTILLMAIAIALILEGLIPALFPNKWQAYVAKLAAEPTSNIRTIGITVMLIGAVILYFAAP
ncbi:MAG: DUF2065 domain-containing protein [Thalassotalea sp.]